MCERDFEFELSSAQIFSKIAQTSSKCFSWKKLELFSKQKTFYSGKSGKFLQSAYKRVFFSEKRIFNKVGKRKTSRWWWASYSFSKPNFIGVSWLASADMQANELAQSQLVYTFVYILKLDRIMRRKVTFNKMNELSLWLQNSESTLNFTV